MRTLAVFLVLVVVFTSDGFAQEGRATGEVGAGTVSAITEAALLARVAGSEVGSNTSAAASAGLSFRMSPRYALGVSATYVVRDLEGLIRSSDLDYVGYGGLQARARSWLTSSLTLDLSPGLILIPHGQQVLCEVRTPGCDAQVTWGTRIVSSWAPGTTMDVALGYRDLGAAFIRLDVMRYDELTVMSMPGSGPVPVPVTRAEDGRRTDLFVGLRADSAAGRIAAPSLAVAFLVLRVMTRG